MLWTLTPASPYNHTDHYRSLHFAIEHVMPLCCLIDDLLDGYESKIYALVSQNWPHPRNGAS